MKILLIEDYKPLRDSMVKGLTEEGYAVDATGDGGEGLWFATSNEIAACRPGGVSGETAGANATMKDLHHD